MQLTTPTGTRLAAALITPPGASTVDGITAGGSGSRVDSSAPCA